MATTKKTRRKRPAMPGAGRPKSTNPSVRARADVREARVDLRRTAASMVDSIVNQAQKKGIEVHPWELGLIPGVRKRAQKTEPNKTELMVLAANGWTRNHFESNTWI